MEQRDGNCHKMSQVVVKCRKLSWRLSQIVVTFFFPSPSRRPLLVFAELRWRLLRWHLTLSNRRGVPNGPFSATKSWVYCFSPALNSSGAKAWHVHPALAARAARLVASYGCLALYPHTQEGDKRRENHDRTLHFGTGKRGHCERGLFAGEIWISKFSRISGKWSESAFFSTVWEFSWNCRISKFSRISRRWTFWKDPFSKRSLFPSPITYPEDPFLTN